MMIPAYDVDHTARHQAQYLDTYGLQCNTRFYFRVKVTVRGSTAYLVLVVILLALTDHFIKSTIS